MKKFFNRMARQGAAIMLSAALIFGAGDYPAYSGINVHAADAAAAIGAFTVTGGTLDTDYAKKRIM